MTLVVSLGVVALYFELTNPYLLSCFGNFLNMPLPFRYSVDVVRDTIESGMSKCILGNRWDGLVASTSSLDFSISSLIIFPLGHTTTQN